MSSRSFVVLSVTMNLHSKDYRLPIFLLAADTPVALVDSRSIGTSCSQTPSEPWMKRVESDFLTHS